MPEPIVPRPPTFAPESESPSVWSQVDERELDAIAKQAADYIGNDTLALLPRLARTVVSMAKRLKALEESPVLTRAQALKVSADDVVVFTIADYYDLPEDTNPIRESLTKLLGCKTVLFVGEDIEVGTQKWRFHATQDVGARPVSQGRLGIARRIR